MASSSRKPSGPPLTAAVTPRDPPSSHVAEADAAVSGTVLPLRAMFLFQRTMQSYRQLKQSPLCGTCVLVMYVWYGSGRGGYVLLQLCAQEALPFGSQFEYASDILPKNNPILLPHCKHTSLPKE